MLLNPSSRSPNITAEASCYATRGSDHGGIGQLVSTNSDAGMNPEVPELRTLSIASGTHSLDGIGSEYGLAHRLYLISSESSNALGAGAATRVERKIVFLASYRL